MRSAIQASKQPRLVYGVLFLALVVRLWAISARPLWYDEAFSVLFANKGPVPMLEGTLGGTSASAAEEHPLLYYTLLWGWMKAFGESPLAVRLFSVLCGLGIVGVVFLLGRAMFDERFGILAAGLAAIAPFQVHYAQEVRMYALMTFLLIAATCALWMGMRTRRWGWWLLFGVCSALAQYTHNLAAFYLIPLALTPVLRRDWLSARAMLFSGFGALLLYLPWLLRLPAQFAKIQGSFWVDRPTIAHLMTALLAFVVNLPVPDGWLPIALFVTLLVVTLALWHTLRIWRARRLDDKVVRRGLWLLYLAFAPPLLLFVFSQWQPVFVVRALLPSGVVFLMWLVWSLGRTNMHGAVQLIASALLVTGMLFGVYQHATYKGFPYSPFAKLDTYLADRSSSGDVILHSNKLTMLPMVYYDRALPQKYLADPPGSGSDTLAPVTQDVLGLRADADPGSAVGEAQRVWLVIFERAIGEYQNLGYGTHPHLAWLDNHFELEDISKWDDVLLYAYVRE